MVPKVRSIPLVALLLLVLREKKISREASKVTAIEHAKLQTMDSFAKLRINRLIPSFPTGDENEME